MKMFVCGVADERSLGSVALRDDSIMKRGATTEACFEFRDRVDYASMERRRSIPREKVLKH